MIIGVDIGYSTTKTSEMVLFQSKVGEPDILNDTANINIDGIKYAIGSGERCIDVNKVDSKITRVLLFAALAMSSPIESHFKVVTGLPVGQFKAQSDQLKKSIMAKPYSMVAFRGIERTISIDDVKIYAQGAGALFSQSIDGPAIIVDIGSRTCDIAYFSVSNGKRSLEKYSTLFSGMYNLYSAIAASVNAQFDLSLPADFSEQILSSGIIVDGKEYGLEPIKGVLAGFLSDIVTELDLNYPIRSTPVFICGGGAAILGKLFCKKYPHSRIMSNSQFANAIGFRKVGEKIWQPK